MVTCPNKNKGFKTAQRWCRGKIRVPPKRKVAWSVSSLYTCSITRFSDFPTAMFLSKTATCGTLTFEPSKTTKSDNALCVQACYGFEGLLLILSRGCFYERQNPKSNLERILWWVHLELYLQGVNIEWVHSTIVYKN